MLELPRKISATDAGEAGSSEAEHGSRRESQPSTTRPGASSSTSGHGTRKGTIAGFDERERSLQRRHVKKVSVPRTPARAGR